MRKTPKDRYDLEVAKVIKTCDGDVHGALKALIMANEYLEAELYQRRVEPLSNGLRSFSN